MNYEVHISDKFKSKNDFEVIEINDLPEKYTVKTETFISKDPNKHYWNQCRIHIYENNTEILYFDRNYSPPPIIYIRQNNKDFLVTSADYQCVTIVNLTDKNIKSYTDDIAYKNGYAFCPVEFTWENNTLGIYGCPWGAIFSTYYFNNIDLNNPVFDYKTAKHDYNDND